MKRYAVGIDLGTTHTAASYFPLARDGGRGPSQPMLPLPQLVSPGVVEPRQLLPSFVYLPNPSEFPQGALALPWGEGDDVVVGELARSHGAKVPARLVSSAKSWLSHPGVDRRQALLPWNAPADVRRISPVEASARVVTHVRRAFEAALGAEAGPLGEQEVIVTVPASFDAAARDLTLEAAAQAGLSQVTLLEEPQAALYAWIEAAGASFRKHLKVGDVILVVDVGGGTSDFSLIAVRERAGEVELLRVAVGDHILLGGDNMDLALAHTVAQRLGAQGRKLDAWQLGMLTHAARSAKEELLTDGSRPAAQLSVASRGSSLIGGTLRAELTLQELEAVVVDGFFPRVEVSATPAVARRTGLTQLSLPYAQDAAVTRHLAAFLTRQASALADSRDAPVDVRGKRFIHPTAVLFNGGVFKAPALKARVLEVLDGWLASDGGARVRELGGSDLDLAVARGAAYYGWVRRGHGLRIRGGTARAYYVGVETAMPAVPGMAPPVRALCVAPFGMEEGTQADVPPQQFGLVVGEPTRFRFFASSTRRDDRVGDLLEEVDELEEVAPIETTLPPGGRPAGELVPVQLQAAVTELGALELRCQEQGGPGRWKLELNVRMRE